ncbi:hypothetical protein [Xenorhabdus sp. TH1]
MTLTEKQQYWAGMIDSQQQSGQTVTVFYQHHAIKLATFYYWTKKTSATA